MRAPHRKRWSGPVSCVISRAFCCTYSWTASGPSCFIVSMSRHRRTVQPDGPAALSVLMCLAVSMIWSMEMRMRR